MRARSLAVLCSIVACSAIDAQAQTNIPATPPLPVPRTIAFDMYKDEMLKLRSQAIAQQAADGGKLTPENDRKFQRRIDHIEEIYRRRLDHGQWRTFGPEHQ